MSYFSGFVESKSDVEQAPIAITNLQQIKGKTVVTGNGLFFDRCHAGGYMLVPVAIFTDYSYCEADLMGTQQTVLGHVKRYELHEPTSTSIPYISVYVDKLQKVGDLYAG